MPLVDRHKADLLRRSRVSSAARVSRVIVTDAGMPLLDALLGELVPAELVAA